MPVDSFEIRIRDSFAEAGRDDPYDATLSMIEFCVDGAPILKVLDRELNFVRHHLIAPAYPLAKWLTENLAFIRLEWPPSEDRMGYEDRHSLRYGGDGYAAPDLIFRSGGDLVEVEFRPRTLKFQPLEFLGQMKGWIRSDVVVEGIARFVGATCELLKMGGEKCRAAAGELSSSLEAGIQRKPDLAVALGLSVPPRAILNLPLDQFDDQVAEFAASTTKSRVYSDIIWARDWFEKLNRKKSGWKKLTDLRAGLSNEQRSQAPDSTPWSAGYSLARSARKLLGLEAKPIGDDRAIIALLDGEWIGAPHKEGQESDIEGIGHPKGLVSTAYPKGTTGAGFALCRGIHEAIVSRRKVPLVTGAYTMAQMSNRAFAAEFLAPAEALKQRIGGTRVGAYKLDSLAEEFSVSPMVIAHQVENHRLGEIRN